MEWWTEGERARDGGVVTRLSNWRRIESPPRAGGDSFVSLVAVDDVSLIGHVMLSRMSVPFEALGLAPVSVRLRLGVRLVPAVAGNGFCTTGKSVFARRTEQIGLVQPSHEKYFSFRFSEIVIYSPRSAPTRGAYASSRTWGGMRWTGMCRETSGPFADGEVVWSWRAHAGAKLSQDSKGLARATVANAGSPGRARNKS